MVVNTNLVSWLSIRQTGEDEIAKRPIRMARKEKKNNATVLNKCTEGFLRFVHLIRERIQVKKLCHLQN